MHRHALTDEQWNRLAKVLPKTRRGPKSEERLFVDAVLFRAKTGIPWRDLPERFGPWKSAFNRFSNWAKRGVWKHVFDALQVEVDETGSIVDATVIRAHQVASGGKGGSGSTLWVVHEVASRRKSTPSSTRMAGRSMSS